MKRVLVVPALAGLLCLPSAVLGQTAASSADSPVVVVAGEGVISAAPDRAWINVGVESRAPSAREAQKRNTEIMAPVLEKLKTAGLPPDAIRTVGYDVQYEWDFVNNKRVGRGYVARNTVEVRVDAIDRLGEILEIAVGAGATTVHGIRFDVKDRAKLENEAIRLAVADARARAEAVAGAAGRTIDRIVRIEERGVSGGPPVPLQRMTLAAEAAVPIEAGRIEVRAEVSLTAALR